LRCSPQRAMALSFTRFFDLTQRRNTVGLDGRSAHRRDIYRQHTNTHNRQTFVLPVGFKPIIPAMREVAEPRLRPCGHQNQCYVHIIHSLVHSFIPLPCAECDNSLFSGSSIPLRYIVFPATLLHQLSFHSLTSSCYLFLGLPVDFLFQIQIQHFFGNSVLFHSLYMSKST
jgi:hypothetical protein